MYLPDHAPMPSDATLVEAAVAEVMPCVLPVTADGRTIQNLLRIIFYACHFGCTDCSERMVRS